MANLSNDSEIQSGIPVKSSSRQNSLTKYVNVNRNFWPWDHGPITQKRVDELLSASADGIFLVHDNPELSGEHILSVQYSGEVHHYRWNHGPISREIAEDLLYGSPDGVFLVRESVSYPGDYTLSICFRRKVEHYRIQCTKASDYRKQSVFIDSDRIFDKITDLVYYYTHTENNGLVTKLRRCLPKELSSNVNNTYLQQQDLLSSQFYTQDSEYESLIITS